MNIDFTDEDNQQLILILKLAVKKVYCQDEQLLKFHKEYRRGIEQAFAFRAGMYLHELLKGPQFESLDLDMEYNKAGNDSKITTNFPNGIRPDLILHKRQCNLNNVIAIEFKGWWNKNQSRDFEKLKDLTLQNGGFKYWIGVFVKVGKEEASYDFFKDGKKVEI